MSLHADDDPHARDSVDLTDDNDDAFLDDPNPLAS